MQPTLTKGVELKTRDNERNGDDDGRKTKFFDATTVTYELKHNIKLTPTPSRRRLNKIKAKTKPKSIKPVTKSPETTITVGDAVKYSGVARTWNPQNCSQVVMKVCKVFLTIEPEDGGSEVRVKN